MTVEWTSGEEKKGINFFENLFSFIPLSKEPLNYWVTMQKTKITVKK